MSEREAAEIARLQESQVRQDRELRDIRQGFERLACQLDALRDSLARWMGGLAVLSAFVGIAVGLGSAYISRR